MPTAEEFERKLRALRFEEQLASVRGGSQPEEPMGSIGASAEMPEAPEPSLGRAVERGVMNMVDPFIGAAKGVGSSLYGLSGLVNKAVDPVRSRVAPGADAALDQFFEQKPEFLQPQSTGQKVGFVGEQIAEVAVPASKIAGAMKGAGRLARAGTMGATDAAITAAQTGGDLDAIKQAGVGAALVEGVLPGAGKIGQAIASPLKRWAQSTYARMLRPSTMAEKAISKEVAPQMLARGEHALTREGLQQKLSNRLDGIKAALDTAWGNLKPGSSMSVTPLLAEIDDAIASYTIKGQPKDKLAAVAMKELNGLKADLYAISTIVKGGNRGGVQMAGNKGIRLPNATVEFENLRKVRQWFDELVSAKGGYNPAVANSLADNTAIGARRIVSNIYRKHINEALPDIGALNKELHLYKQTLDVVEKAAAREIKQGLAYGAAGAVYGGLFSQGDGWQRAKRAAAYGALTGGLRGMFGSTAWRSVSSAAKNFLADALASGDGRLIRSALHASSVEMAKQRQEERAQQIY